MQNPLPGSPHAASSTPGEAPKTGCLNRLVDRHPYAGTLLLFLYFMLMWSCLHFLLGPVISMLHLPFLPRQLVGETLIALIVIIPILLLKWWSETGFTRGITSQGVVICLIPLALFLIPVLCSLPLLVGQASLPVTAMAVLLSLLVGFAEEGFFRGVMLRSLLPKGIWTSVILSSLLFACVHLTNLISGFTPYYVLGQLVLTFGSGVLFAALRLRTRSIWPAIVLHVLRDVSGLILLGMNPSLALSTSLSATLIVNGIFSLLCIVNAVVLLRSSQLLKLRVTYGLAPEPVLPPTPYYPYPTYPGQPSSINYPAYPGQPSSADYPGQPPFIVYPDQQTSHTSHPGYPEQ